MIAEGKVLLIRRGRPPFAGAWSLPGGALETGETLAEGARREIREETGLTVRPVEMLATLDRIVRDAVGRAEYHYVLIEWLCELEAGSAEPVAGGDALTPAWVYEADLPTCEGLDEIAIEVVRKAFARRRERA